ncbi:MAG: hypothetical protein IJV27_12870 [Prevotella sp.]|nr:hypothetical protein [Prevotella sp.]
MMQRKIDIRILVLLSLIAFTALLVFSFSTSFLYHIVSDFDQSIFEIIGKNWSRGYLPYAETWDSKGPIIFFVNMLGYLFLGGRNGIFLLQFANLTVCLYYFYCFLRKRFSWKASLAYTVLSLLSYITICSGGNQVCDYTLLLSAISIFCTYSWAEQFQDTGRPEHSLAYAFAYGLFFSGSFLSRLSNAAGLCVSVLVVAIVLMVFRRWQDLLHNALAFLLGFAVLFVPFAVYFAANGIFGEMWYATFTYNLEYALSSKSSETIHTTSSFLYSLVYFFSVISVLIVSILTLIFNPRRRKTGLIWLSISLFVLCWLYKSYANANYAIVYIPFVCVAMSEFRQLLSKDSRLKAVQYAVYAVFILGFINHIRVFTSYYERGEQPYEKMIQGLKPSYKNSFVAYNCIPDIYLKYDIRPCYRFFVCQDWAIQNGNSLLPKVRETFATGQAEWILVDDAEHSQINDILTDLYWEYRIDKKHHLTLFKRKP